MSEKEKPLKKVKIFLARHENDILLGIMVIYVIALALAIVGDVFRLKWF